MPEGYLSILSGPPEHVLDHQIFPDSGHVALLHKVSLEP